MQKYTSLFKLLSTATFFVLLIGAASSISANEDKRTPIVATEAERNLVLKEMRDFLEAIRSITVSLSTEDMQSIDKTARKVGMAASGEVPPALTAKLPGEFKMLAMQVHRGFDQIALDASEMGDKQQTLEQLGALMGKCVACHAIYRLPES